MKVAEFFLPRINPLALDRPILNGRVFPSCDEIVTAIEIGLWALRINPTDLVESVTEKIRVSALDSRHLKVDHHLDLLSVLRGFVRVFDPLHECARIHVTTGSESDFVAISFKCGARRRLAVIAYQHSDHGLAGQITVDFDSRPTQEVGQICREKLPLAVGTVHLDERKSFHVRFEKGGISPASLLGPTSLSFLRTSVGAPGDVEGQARDHQGKQTYPPIGIHGAQVESPTTSVNPEDAR